MKKRILSVILAIAMIAMLLPALPVSAAEAITWPGINEEVVIGGKTYVYVGVVGEDFTSIELDEEYQIGFGSGYDYAAAGKFGEGYFTWDGVDTLTLNNTTGTFKEYYSVVSIEDFSANIVLEGKNKWTIKNEINHGSEEDPDYTSIYALDLYSGEDTCLHTIKGPGSLTVEAYGKRTVEGIYCDAGLVVDGATLAFDLNGEGDVRGLSVYDNTTLKNGADVTVNAESPDETEGIYCDGDLAINDADLTVNAESLIGVEGIYCNENLAINGADLAINVKGAGNVRAVYGYGDISIRDSRLTGSSRNVAEYDGENDWQGYGHFVYSDNGDVVVDDSIVAASTSANYRAFVLCSSNSLEIKNGSAVEAETTDGYYNYTISGVKLTVSDSYVNSVTDTGHALDATDNDWSGEETIPAELKIQDAVVLLPENAVIKEYTDIFEYHGKSLFLGEKLAKEVRIVPEKFPDVGAGDWFSPAVGFANARGIFIGMDTGDFAPNTALTRAQMMTVLARMAGADVAPEAGEEWYADAVEWAMKNGISDGTRPNDTITREQMVTMIWRFCGEPESTGSYASFPDGNKVSTWAADAVKWAVENQIVRGRETGMLDPLGNATRAEVAQVFKNMLIHY